jgi:hypothetical protein
MVEPCAFSGCGTLARLLVQWSGPSKKVQMAYLCQEHVQELWIRMQPLLAAGMGTWTNRPCSGGG